MTDTVLDRNGNNVMKTDRRQSHPSRTMIFVVGLSSSSTACISSSVLVSRLFQPQCRWHCTGWAGSTLCLSSSHKGLIQNSRNTDFLARCFVTSSCGRGKRSFPLSFLSASCLDKLISDDALRTAHDDTCMTTVPSMHDCFVHRIMMDH